MTESIANNYYQILTRIERACQVANRPANSVQLVCISKGQPTSIIQNLIDLNSANLEPLLIGENYLQEWQKKRPVITGNICLHYTGQLQSKKVKKIVECFDVIQTIDSIELLQQVNQAAEKIDKLIPVFLQVNISDDENKNGFSAERLLSCDWQLVKNCSALKVQGLMTITRLYSEPEQARPDFIALRKLRDTMQAVHKLEYELLLSMGMSADFEIAIQEGADLVRVGTALFGER